MTPTLTTPAPAAPAAEPASETMTKREVIEYLGKSKRTVETMIAQGRLPAEYFNGPNGKQARFKRADVDRLKAEIETPMARAVATSNLPEPFAKHALERLADLFEQAQKRSLEAATFGAHADPPKPWLTPDQAAAYSGLPRKFLLDLAVSGLGNNGERIAFNVATPGKPARWRFCREWLNRAR